MTVNKAITKSCGCGPGQKCRVCLNIPEPDAPEVVKIEGPFDPRSDVSADAYHIARCAREDAREASGRIVKHLWILFVLLPMALGILFAILK